MNNEEKSNPKEFRNQNFEAKKLNTSPKSNKNKDKNLPWWVELLFVQIGFDDNSEDLLVNYKNAFNLFESEFEI